MSQPAQTTVLTGSPEDLQRAGAVLRAGGLVAMPTETVYGLAANALDASAVEAIFAAKERPRWDPLIVHIANLKMLPMVAREFSATARLLADAFWPGPLTMLLPRQPGLPEAVTAGRDLVGVRIPAHPLASALIKAAGVPLAAPSANRFGRISPTSASHVLSELDGRIAAVIDGGECAIGVESTVLAPDTELMTVYRQGGVSLADLRSATGREVLVYVAAPEAIPQALPSPGVGIRHYAPRARLVLVQDQNGLMKAIRQFDLPKVGVMLPTGWTAPQAVRAIFNWGHWSDPTELAHRLYDGLRTLDAAGVAWIVCPLPPSGDSGLEGALRDRLLKAAMPPEKY